MKTIEERHKEYTEDLKVTQLRSLAFFKGCCDEEGMDVEEALLAAVEFLVRIKHGFIKPLQFSLVKYLQIYARKYPNLNIHNQDFSERVEYVWGDDE